MKHLKSTFVGLLALTAASDAFTQGNELGYNPPAKIILAECDQNAMQICRQQWNYCSDICNSDADPDHQQTCWTGCVNRYNHCRIAADCQAAEEIISKYRCGLNRVTPRDSTAMSTRCLTDREFRPWRYAGETVHVDGGYHFNAAAVSWVFAPSRHHVTRGGAAHDHIGR